MIVIINGEAGEVSPSRPRRLRDAPREGTSAELVYATLREHAGRPVPLAEWAALADLVNGEVALSAMVGYLKATYGLEIRERALLSEPGPRVYYR